MKYRVPVDFFISAKSQQEAEEKVKALVKANKKTRLVRDARVFADKPPKITDELRTFLQENYDTDEMTVDHVLEELRDNVMYGAAESDDEPEVVKERNQRHIAELDKIGKKYGGNYPLSFLCGDLYNKDEWEWE